MNTFNLSTRSKEQEWASRLARALRAGAKAGKITLRRPPNLKAWERAFSELTKSVPRSHVEEVLSWYCVHVGEEFVPTCLSAGTFSKRFHSIEAAMRRLGSELEDVAITSEAREVQELLGGLRWPGDEKKDELWTIQVTIDRVRAYHRKLKELLRTYEAQWLEYRDDYLVKAGRPLVPRERRRDYHPPLRKKSILEVMSGFDPMSTSQWWMERVHETAWSWKAWDGNLRAWAWRTDLRIFLDAERERLTNEGWACSDWKAMMAEAGYPVTREVRW